jgi:hypothetical protein
MAAQRADALWVGWGGTALFLASWLLIASIDECGDRRMRGQTGRSPLFGYDAAGNMTSNGTATYVYDAENRLVWTSGYRYIYDGKGERVEKCQAASATTACPISGTTGTLYWRGTGSDTLAETDLGGNDQLLHRCQFQRTDRGRICGS